MAETRQEIQAVLRGLLRSPMFSLLSVATLALGLGVLSGLSSIVDTVLLRPLPFDEPERVLRVYACRTDGLCAGGMRFANYRDWSTSASSIESTAVYERGKLNLMSGDQPLQVEGTRVTADFFRVLGVEPAHGRDFAAEDDRPGALPVAILSHGLWQSRLGGDPNVLGQTLRIDGLEHVVVGVLPQEFRFPSSGEPQLWIPLQLTEEDRANRRTFLYQIIGRLGADADLESARRETEAIAASLEQDHPDSNKGWSIRLVPIQEEIVEPFRPALLMLLGAGVLILTVAVVNVTHLLLVRDAGRRGETALRLALGSGMHRAVVRRMIETLTLTTTAGVLGLFVGFWGAKVFLRLSPVALPRVEDMGLDLRVALYALAMSLVTGLVLGGLTCWKLKRLPLRDALQDHASRSSAGRRSRWLSDLLILLEVAMVFVLLVGAGSMLDSFTGLLNVDPGFEVEDRLTFHLSLSEPKYEEGWQVAQLFSEVLEGVEALPQVESAGAISNLPLSGNYWAGHYFIDGRPVPEPSMQPYIGNEAVAGNYFQAMGIPLEEGRVLSERDHQDAPDTVLIDRSLARLEWEDREPTGDRLSFRSPEGPWRSIVGVVGTTRYDGLDDDLEPQAYFSHEQGLEAYVWHFMDVVVHTPDVDPLSVLPSIRRVVRQVDPSQPVARARTLAQVVRDSLAQPRFLTALLVSLAAMALLLGIVGVFGVISYTLRRRRREIGIRLALGADPKRVLRWAMFQGLRPVLLGLALGLLSVVALRPVLDGFLTGVELTSPKILLPAALLLLLAAFLAIYGSAARAVKVDPLEVLRLE